MNRETAAAHAISNVGEANVNPMLDHAIKYLLAHKPFLARIMKECLPEYRDCSVEDIMSLYIEGDPVVAKVAVHPDQTNPSLNLAKERIDGSATEDNSLSEGLVTYDIRFNALAPKGNDLIGIIINVEAQNDTKPGYSLLRRGIYYCSRMISAQKTQDFQKSNYDDLKKVYSIWVCAREQEAKAKRTITTYSMKETQVIGNVVKDSDEYDLLSIVMIRLGDAPKINDGVVAEDELDQNVIGMLEVLLKGHLSAEQRKDILEQRYGIEMTRQIEEEVGHMCNLSKGIYEDGMAQGMAQGVTQGIGIGVDQNRVESIRALMQSMNWTLEQAIQALKYPMADKEKYAAALN